MAEPLRLLMVEDSADDAALLQHELRRGGFAATAVRVDNEAEFVKALDQGPWDLLVLDYGLPTFGAERALQVVHARELDLPAIVVSGTLPEEDLVRAMRSGARDYIQKDNLARLIPAIKRELTEAAARRARRDAEQALQRHEEQLRFVIENTSDLILVLDARGQFAYQSPAFERMLGHSSKEWVRRAAEELLPEEERPRWRAMLEQAAREPEGSTFLSTRARHRDGSWRAVEALVKSRNDDRGQPIFILSVRDVTERHNLEAQLRQIQKIEAVGQLAGGIAHDFNNLMTAILGYGSQMLRWVDTKHPLRHNLDGILHAAERAAGLTQQLLAFSRKQLLQPKVLNLAEVLEGSRSLLQRLIGEDIELITLTPERLGRVKADPVQVEQVLLNLAINARDAMPQGGRLLLEVADADLDAAYARDHISVKPGRYVMLAVSDNGQGMDRDVQARVFEPFFTTKELGKGTGLGLSTVYGIVKQSGGYIWVYSEPGEGTTFKVYLPRVDDVPEEAVADEPASVASGGGEETILLVEDEHGVRELVRDLLATLGYTVLEASRPEAALAMATAHEGPIDLLISDVVMPKMSGPELARRLREERPELKLLFLSGYSAGMIADRGALPEGARFLQKPFSAEALERTTRDLLDGVAS